MKKYPPSSTRLHQLYIEFLSVLVFTCEFSRIRKKDVVEFKIAEARQRQHRGQKKHSMDFSEDSVHFNKKVYFTLEAGVAEGKEGGQAREKTGNVLNCYELNV